MKTNKKEDGPSLLFFLEISSKKIIHWYLQKNNESVYSHLYIDKVKEATEKNNLIYPIFLHSDSDYKNRSYYFFQQLFQLNIIPSCNKSIFGPLEERHANQAIEQFNFQFKLKLRLFIFFNTPAATLKKKIEEENISNITDKPYSVLTNLVASVVENYNSTFHSRLSMEGVPKKNRTPSLQNSFKINPEQALSSHEFFSIIKLNYQTFENSKDDLSIKIDSIENLDLSDLEDQKKFIEFYVNYFFFCNQNVQDNQLQVRVFQAHLDYNNNDHRLQFHEEVILFYAYALGPSKHKNIVDFLKDHNTSLTVKGPGRQRKFTTDEFFN